MDVELRKMKVLIINEVCGTGSTGKICVTLAKQFLENGDEVKIAYGRLDSVPKECEEYAVCIGAKKDVYWHALFTRVTDRHGFASVKATKEFLKWAEEYNPDLVWLHNIHGYYINIKLLFNWIKSKPSLAVKWTLHDCWTFTGHCSNFSSVHCSQWKTGCRKCPQKKEYPKACISKCSKNYADKKELFSGVGNLEVIVPSEWLKSLVKESFLKEYPVRVVHNEIDRNVFCPTESDFRVQSGITDKKMILGVASVWNEKKGITDFIKLANMLSDEYVIVLVGLSEKQSKVISGKKVSIEIFEEWNRNERLENSSGVVVPQSVFAVYEEITGNVFSKMPEKRAEIIPLQRTENVNALAGLYSTADFFVNMTYEDNYPTVNLEAVACGTKVITYKTGGCPETIGL